MPLCDQTAADGYQSYTCCLTINTTGTRLWYTRYFLLLYDATHLFRVTTYPVSYGDGVWLVVVSVAGELISLVRAVVWPCSATVHCWCCCAVERVVGKSVDRRFISLLQAHSRRPSSLPSLQRYRTHTVCAPCVHYCRIM